MGKIFGIIALFCGILSFVGWTLVNFFPFYCYYYFGSFWLPVAAIVFGIIGISLDDPKKLARIGIVLGFLGILILPILITYFVCLPFTD